MAEEKKILPVFRGRALLTAFSLVLLNFNIGVKKYYYIRGGSSFPTPSEADSINFVLHVGPPKTATSSIQCALQSLGNVLEESDGYTILETESCRSQYKNSDVQQQPHLQKTSKGAVTEDNLLLGEAFMPHCLRNSTGSGVLPACWVDHYIEFLQRQRTLSKSTIVSQENLAAHVTHPHVLEAISQSLEGTSVTLVVTYRPWFEFVLSGFNQQNKNRSMRPKLSRWPGSGGRRVMTAQRAIRHSLENENVPYVFADKIVPLYRNSSSISVNVVDINDGDPVLSFLCDAVPGAANACKRRQDHVQTNTTTTEIKNKRDRTLFYDMIAFDAFKSGFVRSGIGRLAAGEAIKAFHRNELKNSRLPLACPPSDLLDSFLQESLRRERIVYLDQNDTRETRHRKRFSDAIAKHEFCTVNVTKVLEDDRWLQFLKAL